VSQEETNNKNTLTSSST